MEEFSTLRIPQRAKVDYWNQVNCDTFTDIDVVPSNTRGFEGSMSCESFGPLSVTQVTSAPANIHRTDDHVARMQARRFHLIHAVSGRFTLSHAGHRTVVEAGDFALSDVSAPHVVAFDAPIDAIILSIPGDFIRRHIPYPERLAGLHMSGQKGLGQMAAFMIDSLWGQLQAGEGDKIDEKVAGSLMDVVGASYTAHYGEQSGGTAVTDVRRIQLKRYIEANLRDPDLTPRRLAEVFRISPRYVRMLFAVDGETAGCYILRRRLEECARQMKDVLWQGKTITEIAFDWGFSSTAHFSRVFKDHFGVSPRQYREEN